MSKGTMGALSALFAASVCALSGTALAQDAAQETGEVSASAGGGRSGSVGPLRVNAGMHLGFGGNVKSEAGDVETDVDLAVTPGLQIGADYVVMDYLSVGGEMKFGWFITEAGKDLDGDRSFVWDLNIKPKGRYVFANLPLEVYGTLPLGLSVISGNDDAGTDSEAGFNLGFGPGATYFFNNHLGVNTEMLGVFHWFGDEVAGVDVSTRLGQFTWFFNAVYAL